MNHSQLIIYTSPQGKIEMKIHLEEETIWLTQAQLAKLFEKDRDTISEHINNIYREQELDKKATTRKFRVVQKEGTKAINRTLEHYNLDMIIAVGYRVSSKKATQFRIWATNVLRDYLTKGYALNQNRLTESKQMLHEIQNTLKFITSKHTHPEVSGHEQELLHLIQTYSFSLSQMLAFDEKSITVESSGIEIKQEFTIEKAHNLIHEAKTELAQKGEASQLFGSEVSNKFQSILGAVHQTYSGEYLYPTIDEMAANLLYLIIKDHPFADGNKRIGSLCFIYFLQQNDALKKIDDNTLLALALLIAVSDPKEKEVMIRLTRNIINNGTTTSTQT